MQLIRWKGLRWNACSHKALHDTNNNSSSMLSTHTCTLMLKLIACWSTHVLSLSLSLAISISISITSKKKKSHAMVHEWRAAIKHTSMCTFFLSTCSNSLHHAMLNKHALTCCTFKEQSISQVCINNQTAAFVEFGRWAQGTGREFLALRRVCCNWHLWVKTHYTHEHTQKKKKL